MKFFPTLLLIIAVLAGTAANYSAQAETFPAPKIVSRQEWGANPPVAPMKEHEFKYITIHHSGTKQKPDRPMLDKIRGLQKFSQNANTLASGKDKPAWPDIPYHFYIVSDGQIAEGREIKYIGDTNTEYDPAGHILVCLEGSFQEEQPTEAQMKSLREIVPWLAQKYNIPADKIGGHNDYASTSCPGKNLYKHLGELRGAAEKKSNGKPLKALLFAGGCCHDYEKLVPHLTNGIGKLTDISFDVRFDLELWKNETFSDGYDVIVYDVCFEEADSVGMENAFKAAKKGKPTVMLHCAVHAFRKSEKIREWENFCGMRSKFHDPYQVFSTEKLDMKHPAVKNFPANWTTPGDELYQTIEFIEGSTPLLKAKSPHDGREHIVCWSHQYGKGRVFATTLGHDMKTAETPEYIRLLTDGIFWACKLK